MPEPVVLAPLPKPLNEMTDDEIAQFALRFVDLLVTSGPKETWPEWAKEPPK